MRYDSTIGRMIYLFPNSAPVWRKATVVDRNAVPMGDSIGRRVARFPAK